MKRRKPSSALENESALKKSRTALFDNGRSRMKAVGGTSFPEDVSRMVGDYLSSDIEKEYVEAALVGVQPMTLILSQDVGSKLAPFWWLGLPSTSSKQVLNSSNTKISKQFSITDVEGCLSFFEQKNSNDCRVVVEVLVVNFGLAASDSPRALDDLRNALGALQGHLDNMKYVVFSIKEHSACCFTVRNSLDNATGFAPPVNHQQVLLQIVNDLETCWNAGGTLSSQGLFAFYFTSGVQRTSEKYLAKLVISLDDLLNRALFDHEASQKHSNKIMWIYTMYGYERFHSIEPDVIGLCHVICFGMHGVKTLRTEKTVNDLLAHALFRLNSSSIKRLDIHFSDDPFDVKLPRLEAPLKSTTPLSALVELSLIGEKINLHLTQLNNGFFPHLALLHFHGGRITGHLDSDRVPSLQNLDLGYYSARDSVQKSFLARERAQSLMHAGRPWQLVATKEPGGWSLASYEVFASNPQDDGKEDLLPSPHSPPLIRELLLVTENGRNANEWQAQLQGDPSFETAAEDHNDRLLVWAPQCVQKITAIDLGKSSIMLEFHEPIPEQTRSLTSLECHDVNIWLNGAALPNLRSLELNGGKMLPSAGAFPNLKTLTFQDADLLSQWDVEAPLLQSFCCRGVPSGQHLSVDLQSLPRLSFLQIKPVGDDWARSPQLFGGKHTQALSSVHQLWLSGGKMNRDLSKAYQMSNLRHLELTVSALGLPVTWYTAMLPCETLTINVIAANPERLQQQKIRNLVVPPPLRRVKTLRVTSRNCPVVLHDLMPNLTDCSVPSPKSLGPNFKCPALKRIRFTGDLSESGKEKCLNPATYEAIGARPRDVIFAFHYEMHTMTWDAVPNESQLFS